MKIQETEAKSIITPSKLPDADYVVNPYTGCQFGCLYCYASFMGRFVNQPIERWGEYVYAKINAVELFKTEIVRLQRITPPPSILLSSVTDPYQGAEKQYGLTRGILSILASEKYAGVVSILTKSPLVLRDVDLFKELPNVEVGLTVTTTDDKISRFLELRAPNASSRLETLRRLNENRVPTYAFIGPLLPHFRTQPEELDRLFAAVAGAGVKVVFVEHINLKAYIRQRLWPEIADEAPEVQAAYQAATEAAHREEIQAIVNDLLQKYDLQLRLNKVLFHETDARKEPEGKMLRARTSKD